ncbi:MAG: hypothetical protein K2W99_08225 [Chthoniobacterales bacterium]|nr:hypothetical protein [Chthoniobacterales bacterium]
MNSAVLEKPILERLETLVIEIDSLKERFEDIEDLMELRAAVTRNDNKPGISLEQAKARLFN